MYRIQNNQANIPYNSLFSNNNNKQTYLFRNASTTVWPTFFFRLEIGRFQRVVLVCNTFTILKMRGYVSASDHTTWPPGSWMEYVINNLCKRSIWVWKIHDITLILGKNSTLNLNNKRTEIWKNIYIIATSRKDLKNDDKKKEV